MTFFFFWGLHVSLLRVCWFKASMSFDNTALIWPPRAIKNSFVYLWGWGPCRLRRKVHFSGLFPAVWCQNCTHHPFESLGVDGGRIWGAQEPSKASLKNEVQSETCWKCLKHIIWFAQTQLTCIESMRVIVFAGRAKAGQAIICDFQNKSTVHHAIRWLQISMAAKVAVVEIVHSLAEESEALRGVPL